MILVQLLAFVSMVSMQIQRCIGRSPSVCLTPVSISKLIAHGEYGFTRILEQTPGATNFITGLENAILKIGIPFLQSVCKVDPRDARSDYYDIVVDFSRAWRR